MTHKTNDDTNKKQHPTGFVKSSDVQSSYDAEFDFLYNSVPFGEYPEATAADMRNEITEAAKNQID